MAAPVSSSRGPAFTAADVPRGCRAARNTAMSHAASETTATTAIMASCPAESAESGYMMISPPSGTMTVTERATMLQTIWLPG